MESADFSSQSAAFLDWFKAWTGAEFHPHIEIQDLRGRVAGRGIVATEDIPPDTTLFTIPRKAILSTLTSDLSQRIPGLFETSTHGLEDADNEADEDADDSDKPDPWVSLILVMIYEFLHMDDSRWRAYLNVLPAEFDTPMFWSKEELGELEASAVPSHVGRDDAENMFRAKILPVVQEHADVFYPGGTTRLGDEELIALAHRMGSTIMAYAFDLEKDDEDEDDDAGEDGWVEDKDGKLQMGMVPMADILNADAEFNAHVNHGDAALTVTSLRAIPAGSEILNYYGPLSNGELLRRYGYVTDAHAAYDMVEITWESVLAVLKEDLALDDAAWGQALNEIEDEEIEDAFVIDRDLDGPSSDGTATESPRMKHIPSDLQEQINAFLKAVRKVQPDLVPDKRKRDEISYAVIRKALERRLKEYPSRAEDDVRLLGDADLPVRKRMALKVRLGEKMLLREALDLVAEKMEKLPVAADGTAGEPAAKRVRTR